MSETTFIYALCEPGTRTVRYIGKSDDPKRRFRAHLRQSIMAKTHLGNWLRLLAESGTKPDMVVLREVLDDQWEVAEERYIRIALGCGMKLVNGTAGGDGIHNPGPETRAKLAANNVARVWSEETRKKLSRAKTESPSARAHMDRLHAARIGTHNSAEHNANIGRGLLGHKQSPEVCAEMSKSRQGLNRGTCQSLKRQPYFSDGGGI